MLSAKNSMLSAAGADLGLGDQLKSQAEDEILKRKKRMSQMALAAGGSMGAGVGPATQTLFSGGFNA